MATPKWGEIFSGQRGRLVIGLLILEALVAIYALVISTIMPAVWEDLGGTSIYGFVFSAWSLAAVMSIPISGHAADRFGPRRPLLLAMGIFIAGLAISGTAPTVAVFTVGVFVQGAAGGAFYALSLGTVAKTFPESIRAKVLALLAAMWILPGLIGPFLGAMIAYHVGWRWTFAVPLPVVAVSALLVLPALKGIRPEIDAAALPVRWSTQFALGTGVVLYSLTLVNWWTLPLCVIGTAVAAPAARRILPAGILRARPGLPAAAAGMFLLSFAFIAADSFIPILLTQARGTSLSTAGLVITLSTVMWASGSWWQSRAAAHTALGRLEAIGATLLAIGIIGMAAAGLPSVPVWTAFVAWGIAGLGMGIAFPTLPLSAMTVAEAGKEAGQLSSTLLTDTVGMAFGSGLGGVSLAFATRHDPDDVDAIAQGVTGAFAIALIAALVLIGIARRIPGGQGAANVPPSEIVASPSEGS